MEREKPPLTDPAVQDWIRQCLERRVEAHRFGGHLEVKIWNGRASFEQGLTECNHYMKYLDRKHGFYVLFIPSPAKLRRYETRKVEAGLVHMAYVDIKPIAPTKQKSRR
jgi:hypothetical protein